MNRYRRFAVYPLICALLTGWLPSAAVACTTFGIPQSYEKLVGKSYDWHQKHGIVLVNPRNLAKASLLLHPQEVPAKWVSQYGSVTFHQHGRELPLGGINEKGLAIDIMWLDESVYPAMDKNPAVNELQWIQYQLDNFATVDEVVSHAGKLRINPNVAKVHYLVCDASGACATFEYVRGRMVVHHGAKLPLTVLTNDTYANSVKFLLQHAGFGGTLPLPKSEKSLDRFVRAAARVKAFDPATDADAVGYAFDTLKAVEQAGYTAWNIVYESTSRKIHFRTDTMPQVKSIDTTKLDYSCLKQPLYVEMKAPGAGDVTGDFRPFGEKENLALVSQGLAPFMGQLPQGTVELVASYPQLLQCQE